MAGLLMVGVLALTAYAAILRSFELESFYYTHFHDRGAAVVRYNGLRLAFGLCLAWLVYAAGYLLLSVRPLGSALPALPALDRVLVRCFAGASAWYVLLLMIGLAGFLTRPTMLALTFLVLAGSLVHARDSLWFAAGRLRRIPAASRARALAGAALLLPVVCAFVMVKGIYPAGGHDYYTHYFYYYLQVIKTGSLIPNDIWYHFYYSKGAGLFFLAMLLTDPLAPQIVTTVLMGIGTATVFAVLRQLAPSTFIPWLGAALYLALLVYAPGPLASYRQGGWADLEKLHEPAAVLVLGIVWLTARALAAARDERLTWIVALLLSVAALVTITAALAFFVGAFFLLLAAWLALHRDWRSATVPLSGALGAGVSLAAILGINQAMTGLLLDQLLLYAWPAADLSKIEAWGVLNEVLLLHWSLTEWLSRKMEMTPASLTLLVQYLRLDLCSPMALGAGVILAAKLFGRPWMGGDVPAPLRRPTFMVLLALPAMVVLLFALGIGREQPISFYRLTTFLYAPVLCLTLGAWVYCPPRMRAALAAGALALGIGLVWFLSLAANIEYERFLGLVRRNIGSVFVNASRFADGRYGIADAYRNQQGWPGRQPWGGIYPAMETVSRIVGPDVPVYSMHVHSYCMLPRCTVYGHMSMRLARDSSTVMYGQPEEAKRVLEREGINYFFVSRDLEIRSPLPLSPLFSPDRIASHLAIRWTDGTSYLLTWPDAATMRIDEDFVERYRAQSAASPTVSSFPYEDLGMVYEHFKGHGLTPYRLPWCRTCDAMSGEIRHMTAPTDRSEDAQLHHPAVVQAQ